MVHFLNAFVHFRPLKRPETLLNTSDKVPPRQNKSEHAVAPHYAEQAAFFRDTGVRSCRHAADSSARPRARALPGAAIAAGSLPCGRVLSILSVRLTIPSLHK